jgi:hypothetical protein
LARFKRPRSRDGGRLSKQPASKASEPDLSHCCQCMIGTVLMEFAGEPLTIFVLIAT